jgi:hypothetical protein
MNDQPHEQTEEELEAQLALLRAARDAADREGLPSANYDRQIRERERVLEERL